MPKPAIEIQNVVKSFGTNRVLRGITLTIQAKESLVIIGRSGCGKSVLVKCILGLLPIDSGSIRMGGIEVTTASSGRLRKMRDQVGVLFQNGALFDSMSVAENILFPLRTRRVSPQSLGVTNEAEVVRKALFRVGLGVELMDAKPAQLSGGQRKRVGLARAIVTVPSLLFFDEPTTGLDPVMSSSINALLAYQTQTLSATAVTITHDMGTVEQIATKVVLIEEGTIAWSGSRDELYQAQHPLLERFLAYRGAA